MKKLITNIPKNKLNKAIVSSFSPANLGFSNPNLIRDFAGCQISAFESSGLLFCYITKNQLTLEKKIVRELVDNQIKKITFIGVGIEIGESNLKGFVITDHVNMSGLNPLRGVNDDKYGVRFPDMSNTYQIDFDKNKLTEIRLDKAKLLIPKNIENLSAIEKEALEKNKELQVISEETYFGVITAKQAGCRIRVIILKEPTDINSLFT